jgi:hypothetical protein
MLLIDFLHFRCDVDGEDWCVTSWNQHIPIYCGSCWAHGTLSMINDRLKIKKKGKGPDVMLARQSLLNCGHYEKMGHGCDGGDVIDVMEFMSKFGLPDESCMTYAPFCSRLCANVLGRKLGIKSLAPAQPSSGTYQFRVKL